MLNKLSSGDMHGYRLSTLQAVGLLCASKVRETDCNELEMTDNIIADIWLSIRKIANPSEIIDKIENKTVLKDLVTGTKNEIANKELFTLFLFPFFD